jgi:transcriptional regulator with XRE-family HTH domain
MNTMPTTVSQEDLEDLVDLLRDYLRQTGETQGALAMRAGVRREMVALLLNGKYTSSPTFDNVAKIAHAIGFKVHWERA